MQAGVTQAQIDQMMIENPRRFFAGGGGSVDSALQSVATQAQA
jgi:hypothetical protein